MKPLDRRGFLKSFMALGASAGLAASAPWSAGAARPSKRPNIIFILSDDHRYDFMSCVPGAPSFLETPNMDRMAREGVRLENAFVSTSLCSPSRASILTGQYMHHHRVVDNQRPVPAGTRFFPEYLQKAGYQTAFVGKWHMGHDSDKAQKGFDHWASFQGQGVYEDPTLNINGKRKEFKGYISDILTDVALGWLKEREESAQPFFLYLSHKATHYPFQPAKRHRGLYEKAEIKNPETMANTEANYSSQSRWIRERRYSIHGVDHMETGHYDNDPVPSFPDLYKRFCETVVGIDENVGRALKHLDESGLVDNTLVFYMGDNGFELGEHGFYDKRDAFEESIRVPLLAYGPKWIKPETRVTEMVQNIDIAPTLLEAAGAPLPAEMQVDGRSFWPLLRGEEVAWRDHILYEYHWEWNFPATPTTLAIRSDRYKFIYYHGVWDKNGFYDLETDPHEKHNLIEVPAYREQIAAMKKQLFDEMEASGGLVQPIRRPVGERLGERKLRR